MRTAATSPCRAWDRSRLATSSQRTSEPSRRTVKPEYMRILRGSGVTGDRDVTLTAIGEVGQHLAAGLAPAVAAERIEVDPDHEPGVDAGGPQQQPADQPALLALRVQHMPGGGRANGLVDRLNPGLIRRVEGTADSTPGGHGGRP